jgi:hypothetical protein
MKTMVFVLSTGDLDRHESDRCSILAAVIRSFDLYSLRVVRAAVLAAGYDHIAFRAAPSSNVCITTWRVRPRVASGRSTAQTSASGGPDACTLETCGTIALTFSHSFGVPIILPGISVVCAALRPPATVLQPSRLLTLPVLFR